MTANGEVSVYNAVRDEIILRIRLRDQNIVAYLATVGVILGFTFKDGSIASSESYYLVAISIPFICVVFSTIISNHHVGISHLGGFLSANFKVLCGIETWDASIERKENSNLTRYLVNAILMSIPAIFLLFVQWQSSAISIPNSLKDLLVSLTTALNIGALFYVGWTNYDAYRKRERIQAGVARQSDGSANKFAGELESSQIGDN